MKYYFVQNYAYCKLAKHFFKIIFCQFHVIISGYMNQRAPESCSDDSLSEYLLLEKPNFSTSNLYLVHPTH